MGDPALLLTAKRGRGSGGFPLTSRLFISLVIIITMSIQTSQNLMCILAGGHNKFNVFNVFGKFIKKNQFMIIKLRQDMLKHQVMTPLKHILYKKNNLITL